MGRFIGVRRITRPHVCDTPTIRWYHRTWLVWECECKKRYRLEYASVLPSSPRLWINFPTPLEELRESWVQTPPPGGSGGSDSVDTGQVVR